MPLFPFLEHVAEWYESNAVCFIKKYSYLAKLWQKMALMWAPIFGHTIFCHDSAIFGTIGLKFLMGAQLKIIIYRLVIRNPSYNVYFLISGVNPSI